MSAAPSQTPQDDDRDYYRTVLHTLIDLGTDLARRIHQNPDATPDPTVAFERVAKTIRRTILLAQHLNQPPKPLPRPVSRTAARKRIIRKVEDAIQCFGERPDAPELHRELLDRLDSPDLEDDLATRPIPEIIEEIIRDLGIDAMPGGPSPWKRRTPQDLAILQACAASTPDYPAANPAVLLHPTRFRGK